jgi:hypothetical protein
MPAAKPTTARRPPARALTATAPLEFDDEDEVGALPAAVPVPELEVEAVPEPDPDPDPVVLDEEAGVPSADDALAAAWNAAKVLF